MHVLHPLLIWREAREELEQPDFWAKYDIPRIVGGATMLDVRNAGLGVQQQLQEMQTDPSRPPSIERGRASRPSSAIEIPPPPTLEPVAPDDLAGGAPLSSSLETVDVGGDLLEAARPVRLKVSLTDMVATSVALRSGLDIEIVDGGPAWTSTLFPIEPRTRSPSRNASESSHPLDDVSETSGTPAHPDERRGDGTIPRHVAEAISGLQREVILLRNDLNLELWTARENVKHIGRLYKERVLSRNEEVERQGLVRD